MTLQRIWAKPVLDRVGLIIEIFNAHAHTKEAKLQVLWQYRFVLLHTRKGLLIADRFIHSQAELAALMYNKSRLVRVRGTDGRHTFGQFGEAEVVSARGWVINLYYFVYSLYSFDFWDNDETVVKLLCRRAGSKGTGGGFVGGAGETELQLQRRRSCLIVG